jgi:hypothetical protein
MDIANDGGLVGDHATFGVIITVNKKLPYLIHTTLLTFEAYGTLPQPGLALPYGYHGHKSSTVGQTDVTPIMVTTWRTNTVALLITP